MREGQRPVDDETKEICDNPYHQAADFSGAQFRITSTMSGYYAIEQETA
jgi:hypothetical protein